MLHESHFAYLNIKISFLKQTDENFIMILKELHQKLLNILFLYFYHEKHNIWRIFLFHYVWIKSQTAVHNLL